MTGGDYAPARRSDCATLRAELCAEALGESPHDSLPERGRVVVGQRPLRRLEGDPEGDRLLARARLRATVDVERAHLAKLRTGCFTRGVHELRGHHVLADDER